MDKELFKKMFSKLFACIRYQMYQMIKNYWEQNKNTLLAEFEYKRKQREEHNMMNNMALPSEGDVENDNPIEEE